MRRLPLSLLQLDPLQQQQFDPSGMAGMQSPTLHDPHKQDWRAAAFDRFVPGGADMSDGDKSSSFRQGLLQLAAGLQSSRNFGEGLTRGLSGGLLSMNKGVDDAQERRYKQAALASKDGAPTEFQAKHMMAVAAGYQPGTPEYQHFMRVQGGIEGRASNGGYDFQMVPGADGKPRLQRRNKSTGTTDVFDETQGDFAPVGSGPAPAAIPPPPSMPSGGSASVMHNAIEGVESNHNPNAVSSAGALGSMQTMPTTLRDPGFGVQPARDGSPAEMARVGRDYYDAMLAKYHGNTALALAAYNAGPGRMDGLLASNGNNPTAALAHAPAETRAYVPRVLNRANPSMLVGQSPGEKAAQEAQATANVDLRMKPRIEAATKGAEIDTTNSRGAQTNAVAADKSRMETEGTATGTRNAKFAQKASDAQQQLPVLAEIKKLLPFATNGVVDNMKNRTAGFFGASTGESQTDAKLRPLAARILQTVPRFEGPQSDKDVQSYKDAAGDLANPDAPRATRLAALAELERLARKAAAPQTSAKPSAGKLSAAEQAELNQLRTHFGRK